MLPCVRAIEKSLQTGCRGGSPWRHPVRGTGNRGCPRSPSLLSLPPKAAQKDFYIALCRAFTNIVEKHSFRYNEGRNDRSFARMKETMERKLHVIVRYERLRGCK